MRALCVAVAVLLLATTAAAEPTQADRDQALELFREGNKAFSGGDLHAAYDAYRQAWSLHPSFDIACNLGRTEAELALDVAAAEHLDYCLRTFATSSKSGLRDAERKFRDLFDQVRGRVGGVRVSLRPVSAEVLIDGASMGSGPFERELFAAPGEHRIAVRAKGYREHSETLNLAAGSSQSLEIKLEPERATEPAKTPTPSAAPVASPPPPAPQADRPPLYRRPSGPEPRTIVLVTGAGVTLVGLGLGLALTLDASSAADETDALRGEASTAGCTSDARAGTCKRYLDSIDHEKSSRRMANVAFVASGIVGAATAGLWLVLPERAAEIVAGVQPWLSTASGGVAVTGRY